MSGISEYGAAQWGAVMFGVATLPATFYVALCSDEPGEGWDGSVLAEVEPTDPAYLRQPIANDGTGWALSDGGFIINVNELVYPTPTEDWEVQRLFALLDDPDVGSGNLWSWGWLLDELFVSEGLDFSLPVGTIYHALGNQQQTITD